MTLVTLLFALLLGVRAGDGTVIALTDKNFEGETQASTGLTTGAWFIKFYAPWCGHCKRLVPTWEKLATELEETGVNVAKVDVTENRGVGNRFGVSGFPTLIYISPRKGKMTKYGKARTLEDLKEFAMSDGGDAEFVDIPGEPNIIDKLRTQVEETVQEGVDVANKAPRAAGLILTLGILIGMIIGMLMAPSGPSRPTARIPPSYAKPPPGKPKAKAATAAGKKADSGAGSTATSGSNSPDGKTGGSAKKKRRKKKNNNSGNKKSD